MKDWIRTSVLWHVYPLGFVDAPRHQPDNAEVVHRLSALEAWLDYAQALGMTGLALGPVFASTSHGYDTTDYFRIDPRLGTEADLVSLIDAAHARGMSVILDGVFNHVGRDHHLVQSALAGDADAASWLKWSDGHLYYFEGHGQLVELNHDSQQVVDGVAAIMRYWCARGVDGWRLDAAYSVNPRFWDKVLPQLRAEFPDVYIYGEMIHGDYASYVATSGLDSITQYELWKALWNAPKEGNYFELAHAIERHNVFIHPESGGAGFVPVTFVGNHDVTRVAEHVDKATLPLVHASHLLLPGTPLVYYGDEQGFHGVKEERPGGDDAVRPAFPSSPDQLSTLGRWVYDQIAEIVALRAQRPWLADAYVHVQDVTNETIIWRIDAADPGNQDYLWVALNNSDDQLELSIDSHEVLACSHRDQATATLCPPHSWWVGV